MQKESFDLNQFKKFKQYFKIKEKPSQIELEYIKKTQKYVKFIKFLPWLQMVWICNSISMNAWKSESDIDLFIITTPNTMWFNRIIITLIFELLRVRKTDKKHSSMFCLSFFTTTNSLNFENIKLKNDIYLYFFIIYLKPIINYNNTYEKFIEENKKHYNFDKYKNIMMDSKKYTIEEKTKKNPGIIWTIFDKILKNIFLKRTLRKYNLLWKPYWIIINDNMLKFHPKDIRMKLKKELNI